MTKLGSQHNGFTLVEMLVALAIFAMISAAGVALLQSASSTQLAVKDRLEDLSGNARAIALLEADLAQAIARPVRGRGLSLPAFAAQGNEISGQLFSVTRTGGSNFDNAARSNVQRVSYALQGGKLLRSQAAMPDGGIRQNAILLEDLASSTVRFRDQGGNWRTDWSAEDPAALPRALELLLTPAKGAPLRLLFLVGVGQPLPPKDEVQDENNAPA
jgi:general secretion pathway protein J